MLCPSQAPSLTSTFSRRVSGDSNVCHTCNYFTRTRLEEVLLCSFAIVALQIIPGMTIYNPYCQLQAGYSRLLIPGSARYSVKCRFWPQKQVSHSWLTPEYRPVFNTYGDAQ